MNKVQRITAASVLIGISGPAAAFALYVSRVSGRSSSGFATRVASGNFQRASFASAHGGRSAGASVAVPRSIVRTHGSMSAAFDAGSAREPRLGGVSSFAPPSFSRLSSLRGPKVLRQSSDLTPVPTTREPMPMGGVGIVFPQGYAFAPPKSPTVGAPLPSIESETLRRQYPNAAPVLGPHDVIVPQQGGGQGASGAFMPMFVYPGENQNLGTQKGPDGGDR